MKRFSISERIFTDQEPIGHFWVGIFETEGEEQEVCRHDGDPAILARHVLRTMGKPEFREAFTGAFMEQIINNLNAN